ncbi:cysteine synthase A [Ferroacidibacillus organovorans]|uniref:Cysteine synthase n=1 Tax=Ferroacidibacillus organovorans TaxID=1765683 RepID=A0A162UQW1_9BACL|nr:cysteine synthase A [Ferroacidibacillus organovorans]OAG94991.1 cysteine synthase [Ferroacidibacillus organovorans]OPG15052.1 cysteine synthase A [Ferroacidibacillus organovorans]
MVAQISKVWRERIVNTEDRVTSLIGKTPAVKLRTLVPAEAADVYVKLEWFNPGGSVKDRIALAMVEDAERSGKLRAGDTIVEPTSGNTGIGLAMVAAAKGYKAILVMPDTMSVERRSLLRAYGAEVVLTPGAQGMRGAIAKAEEIAATDSEKFFIPQQFDNPANSRVHEETTGPEIVEQMGGQLDAFIAGVGTGGTVTGVGRVLKREIPNCKIIAVEPTDSPVLSGGNPGPHKIQGIGAGFIPSILDVKLLDRVIQVRNEDAFEMARAAAKQEGILVGISTGAAIFASIQVAKELGRGKRVLTVSPSNGERYLSTALFQFD